MINAYLTTTAIISNLVVLTNLYQGYSNVFTDQSLVYVGDMFI